MNLKGEDQSQMSGAPENVRVGSLPYSTRYTFLKASFIRSMEYDYFAEEMRITFSDGNTSVFHNVPNRLIQDMLAAPSIGKYYHAKIKGRFETSKFS